MSTKNSAVSGANGPQPVFIDSDVGWDDWCAITLMVKSQVANIVGVSVNGCGEAYITPAFENARNLLQLLGRPDIPVFKGQPVPSSFSNVFPSDFRRSISSVYGYELPKSTAPVDPTDPATALLAAIEQYPDLIYLSIGGGTNFARFLQQTAPQGKTPNQAVIMGGAVEGEQGNVADLFPAAYPNNKVSEWNMFIDPVAAHDVLGKASVIGSGPIGISLVPLNAAYQVQLTQAVVDMFAAAQTEPGKFIHFVLQTKLKQAEQGGYKEYFYDPLAAATILYPGLVARKVGSFAVVTDYDQEDNRLGQTLFTADPSARAEYCHDPDAQGFYQLFADTILGNTPA